MDYRSLHMKTVVDLRQIAKAEGVKLPAGVNKARIVELILEKQAAAEAEPQAKTPAVQPQPAPEAPRAV